VRCAPIIEGVSAEALSVVSEPAREVRKKALAVAALAEAASPAFKIPRRVHLGMKSSELSGITSFP